jgi:hypothetical protein
MISLREIVKEIMEDLSPPPPPPAIVQQNPSAINTNAIANAIYVAEGGDKTKYPYGISKKKSGIQTLNKDDARKICINTIGHAYNDWKAKGSKGDFIDFLSLKYCPENHIHWAKMIKSIMAKQKK